MKQAEWRDDNAITLDSSFGSDLISSKTEKKIELNKDWHYEKLQCSEGFHKKNI
jgi:hypothetical protein